MRIVKFFDKLKLLKKRNLDKKDDVDTNDISFYKIRSSENKLNLVVSKILPLSIIGILFLVWIFTYAVADLGFMFYIFPVYAYLVPFFVLHRKIFIMSIRMRKDKSVKPYFKKLTYERALLRLRNIEKQYKHSIVLLISVSTLVGMGLFFVYQNIDENRDYYFDQLLTYNKKIGEIKTYDIDQLRIFSEEKIDTMSDYRKKLYLRDIIFEEIISEEKNKGNIITENIAWDMSYNRTSNMITEEIDSNLIQKINVMQHEQLLEYVLKIIEREKPSSYLYDNESNLKQLDFLYGLLLLPISMFYATIIFKSFFRQKDSAYFFSLSCFKTILSIPQRDEMEKRNFLKLGIKYYEKFLKKNLNMKIKDLQKINSLLLIKSSISIDETAKEISEQLEKGHQLNLLEYFSVKIKKALSEILIQDPLIDRLKTPLTVITTTISAIIGTVGFIVVYFLNPPS